MERYLMYLRKSRMDTDYENVSVAETLSRHRKILEDFCKMRRLHVVEVLEEVVSGESMHARPEMMRLLGLISTGMYAGVVCMDIERLSRGSSMDSGYIMQVLQVNNCKVSLCEASHKQVYVEYREMKSFAHFLLYSFNVPFSYYT